MTCPLIILIATAGRPESICRTLRSLAACRRPAIFERVIVVENGARHGIEEALRSLRQETGLPVDYLYFERGNKSLALNHGLEHIPQGLILFLDDDIECDAGLLEAYAQAADGIEGGVFYGGQLLPRYEAGPPPDWLRPYFPASVRGLDYDQIHSAEDIHFFFGGNWAAFAGDLRRCGGFDPAFGPGSNPRLVGEETQMQKVLADHDCKRVLVKTARVIHRVTGDKTTPRWVLKKRYWYGFTRALTAPVGFKELRLRGWDLQKLGFKALRQFCLRKRYPHRFKTLYKLAYAYGLFKGSLLHFRSQRARQPSPVVAAESKRL